MDLDEKIFDFIRNLDYNENVNLYIFNNKERKLNGIFVNKANI